MTPISTELIATEPGLPATASLEPPAAEPPADSQPEPPSHATPASAPALGALDELDGHVLGRHVKTVFGCWIFLFGLVGAQLGWLLRPFIGDPEQPFTWFRPRASNFFEAVWGVVQSLLGQ